MNIAAENAAARANQTLTHEQLETLKRTKDTAALVGATSNAYASPPDGYAIALEKLAPQAPTVAATVPTHHDRRGFKTSQTRNTVPAPDGYALALDEIARRRSNHG